MPFSRFNKNLLLFLAGIIIVGGFLLLAAGKANATCICENDPWNFDYSAIEYENFCVSMCYPEAVKVWSPPPAILSFCCCNDGSNTSYPVGPTNQCPGFCGGDEEVQGLVSYDRNRDQPDCPDLTSSDACGGPCPDGQLCDLSLNECVDPNDLGSTDACGGNCPPDYYCDPTGSEDGTAACLLFDYENSRSNCYDVCDLTGCREVCDGGGATGGDSPTGGGTTGGGSPTGPRPFIGPLNVQMPNFVGVDSISELILRLIEFLVLLAIPFAVLMLVWSGFLFVTAQGSPDKIEKAKKNLLWTVIGVAIIMASQAIVGYITEILNDGAGETSALVEKIENTIRQIIVFLFTLVTVYFLWGVAEFVRASASGDTAKLETGKKHMVWGIVGMTVMALAWVIVQAFQSYFQ